MSRCAFCLCILSLVFSACITFACGGSSRQIQVITVGPASADAQDFPNGQVPFVATGSYNSAPMTVTPLQANWAAQSEQMVNGIETFGPANGRGAMPCKAPPNSLAPEKTLSVRDANFQLRMA